MPYYAVRKGRTPGVYKDWPSCQAQVKQFPKPIYKKFPTEQEAWDFVKGVTRSVTPEDAGESSADESESAAPSSSSSNNSNNSAQAQRSQKSPRRASAGQRQAADQSSAFEAVGMLRATARSLRAAAEQLLSSVDNLSVQIDQVAGFLYSGSGSPTGAAFSKGSGGVRDSLKRSYSDFTPLGGGGAEGVANKPKKARSDPAGCTECGFTGTPFPDYLGTAVYTDGASFNNGCATARAGIGIFWGHSNPYNKCERLAGRQTNNRAEIHAAEIAVRQARERGLSNVILYTDSQFLINGITKWIHKWKRNGWKLSTGGDVINREDFEQLDEAIRGMNIKWVHVRGHCGIEGNEAADKLANEGARKPLV